MDEIQKEPVRAIVSVEPDSRAKIGVIVCRSMRADWIGRFYSDDFGGSPGFSLGFRVPCLPGRIPGKSSTNRPRGRPCGRQLVQVVGGADRRPFPPCILNSATQELPRSACLLDLSEAVAASIRTYEANRDRMRYDLYRTHGLPVGPRIAKGAYKHIVGNPFNQSGCHWSKANASAAFAIRCCFENMPWPDFLDWRACRAAAAQPKKVDRTHVEFQCDTKHLPMVR